MFIDKKAKLYNKKENLKRYYHLLFIFEQRARVIPCLQLQYAQQNLY